MHDGRVALGPRLDHLGPSTSHRRAIRYSGPAGSMAKEADRRGLGVARPARRAARRAARRPHRVLGTRERDDLPSAAGAATAVRHVCATRCGAGAAAGEPRQARPRQPSSPRPHETGGARAACGRRHRRRRRPPPPQPACAASLAASERTSSSHAAASIPPRLSSGQRRCARAGRLQHRRGWRRDAARERRLQPRRFAARPDCGALALGHQQQRRRVLLDRPAQAERRPRAHPARAAAPPARAARAPASAASPTSPPPRTPAGRLAARRLAARRCRAGGGVLLDEASAAQGTHSVSSRQPGVGRRDRQPVALGQAARRRPAARRCRSRQRCRRRRLRRAAARRVSTRRGWRAR